MEDQIQAQAIPPNINYDDPKALFKIIDSFNQMQRRVNELEERLTDVEDVVLE